MTDMKYAYPAIFTKEGSAYSVIFPDLEIATSGESITEAMSMAEDALCLTLYDMEQRKVEIPKATDIEEVKHEDGSFVNYITCDTLAYRMKCDSRAVRKTVSLPAWLNDIADRQNISCSAVLREALKKELNIA